MPAKLRAKALALLQDGELSPPRLADLAKRDVGLLYDLMEINYGEDDIDAVDQLRRIASEAAQLILAEQRSER